MKKYSIYLNSSRGYYLFQPRASAATIQGRLLYRPWRIILKNGPIMLCFICFKYLYYAPLLFYSAPTDFLYVRIMLTQRTHLAEPLLALEDRVYSLAEPRLLGSGEMPIRHLFHGDVRLRNNVPQKRDISLYEIKRGGVLSRSFSSEQVVSSPNGIGRAYRHIKTQPVFWASVRSS